MAANEVLGVWKKNDYGEVRATLSQYKGTTYLDIRFWYAADDGTRKPTPKGVTVHPEHLPALAAAVAAARKRLGGDALEDGEHIADHLKHLPPPKPNRQRQPAGATKAG